MENLSIYKATVLWSICSLTAMTIWASLHYILTLSCMNLHVLCFHCNREAKHKLEDQRLMLCFSSLHVALNFSFTYPTVLMFISYTLSTVPFDHLSQPLDYPHLVTSAPHSHRASLIWFHISPLSYPSYCCILTIFPPPSQSWCRVSVQNIKYTLCFHWCCLSCWVCGVILFLFQMQQVVEKTNGIFTFVVMGLEFKIRFVTIVQCWWSHTWNYAHSMVVLSLKKSIP